MASQVAKPLDKYLRRLNDYFVGWSSSDMLCIPSLNYAARIAQCIHLCYATEFNISLAVALYDFFQTKVPDSLRPSGTQKDISDFYSCAQSTASTHYCKLLEDRQRDLDSYGPINKQSTI